MRCGPRSFGYNLLPLSRIHAMLHPPREIRLGSRRGTEADFVFHASLWQGRGVFPQDLARLSAGRPFESHRKETPSQGDRLIKQPISSGGTSRRDQGNISAFFENRWRDCLASPFTKSTNASFSKRTPKELLWLFSLEEMWTTALNHLSQQIRQYFVRPESHQRALVCLQG